MKRVLFIKMLLVILVVMLSFTVIANELIDDFELQYQAEEKILLEGLDGEEDILINDDFPSEPKIAPSESKIVFISPYLWEMIGEVYLYDLEEQEEKKIVSRDDLPEQMTAKEVKWITDDYLLLIIGKAYGTPSEGGDLYWLEVETNELYTVSKLEKNKEYKSIKLKEEEIILEMAIFDEQHLEYEIEEHTYSKKDLIKLLE